MITPQDGADARLFQGEDSRFRPGQISRRAAARSSIDHFQFRSWARSITMGPPGQVPSGFLPLAHRTDSIL